MAPTLRVLGTGTANPTATTAINPTVGAGATATDISILSVAMKPYSTTITTPSGWTKIGEWTNGTVASAADVGSTKIALFYQVGAAVGAIGNLTFSGADTAAAGIVTFQNSTGVWDVANVVSAADTTDGTGFSATAASGINVSAASDIVLAALALNSDVGTLSATSFLGMTGATQQTQSGAFNQPNSQGNDCRLYVRYVNFSAGSSNAAPGMSITSTSAFSGTVAFLRVRELPGSGSTLGWTGAVSADGSTGTATDSSLAVTSAVTADGVLGLADAGPTLAWTAAVTASGVVGTSTAASLTWTAAVASAGGGSWRDGILADWNADDLTGGDGASISAWTDRIGGFVTDQVTSTARPTLRAGAVNGHQALEFDGTTDWLALPAGAKALAQNVGSLAVFVVLTMPNSAVTGVRTAFSLSSGTSTSAARVSVQARNSSGFPAAAGRRLDADASVAQAAGTAALSQPYLGVLTARYLWSSSDAYIYQDGTQIGVNLSFQTSGVTDNTVSLNGAIGARPEGTIERYNGQIVRILVFPDADAAKRSLVHSYLADTYGLTVSDYAAGTGYSGTATVGAVAAVSVTGGTSYATTSTVTGTATITATGVVGMVAASTVATTAAVVSAGNAGISRAANTVATTAAVTPTGSAGLSGTAATIAATAAVSATGNAGLTGTAATVATTFGVAATGSIGKSTDAALAVAAGVTGTGAAGLSSAAAVPVTATIAPLGAGGFSSTVASTFAVSATGVVGRSSAAALAVTATVVAAGAASLGVNPPSEALVPFTATATGSGFVTSTNGANLTFTAGIFAIGQIGLAGTAARPITATVTATGGTSGGLSTTWTAGVTATGTVTPALTKAATASSAFAVAATGTANSSRTAALAATATITASGAGGLVQGATVSAGFSLTTAGVKGLPTGAAAAATASVVAAGVANVAGSGAVAVTASVTATGFVGLVPAVVTVPATFATAAAGTAGSAAASSLAATVAVAAAGEITGLAVDATVDVNCLITASGQVTGTASASLIVTAAVTAVGDISAMIEYTGPTLTAGSPSATSWKVGRPRRTSVFSTAGATNSGLSRKPARPRPVTRGNP